MAISEERQPPSPAVRSRSSRLVHAVGILCFLIFAALVVLKAGFPLKNESRVETHLLAELQELKFEDPVPASKDWPQWRGPNRDGVCGDTGLLLDWPDEGPPKLWERPLGKGFSSIVVADKRAYSLFQDKEDEAVICFDAESGQELWRFRYRADYHNSFGDGPRSTPTIDGDLLFTVGGTGIMHCLRTHPRSPDGEMVWRKDLLAEFDADNLKWGVSFSPLVVDDKVFIMPGGRGGNSVAALDKHTGALAWKALDDQAGYASPITFTSHGQQHVVFFTGLNLAAFAPDTGKELWRFPWVTQEGCNIATPIYFQDYVFISSAYGHGCALLKIVKTADGLKARAVFESQGMRNHHSSSVRYQDHVYGFNDSTLTCLDLRAGGKTAWDDRAVEKGSLILAEGHLIALGEKGTLAVVEATPTEFRRRGIVELPRGRYWSTPTLAQGRLYVRNEKKVFCFDLKKR